MCDNNNLKQRTIPTRVVGNTVDVSVLANLCENSLITRIIFFLLLNVVLLNKQTIASRKIHPVIVKVSFQQAPAVVKIQMYAN